MLDLEVSPWKEKITIGKIVSPMSNDSDAKVDKL